ASRASGSSGRIVTRLKRPHTQAGESHWYKGTSTVRTNGVTCAAYTGRDTPRRPGVMVLQTPVGIRFATPGAKLLEPFASLRLRVALPGVRHCISHAGARRR